MLRSVGGDPAISSIPYPRRRQRRRRDRRRARLFAPSGLGVREASMYGLLLAVVSEAVRARRDRDQPARDHGRRGAAPARRGAAHPPASGREPRGFHLHDPVIGSSRGLRRPSRAWACRHTAFRSRPRLRPAAARHRQRPPQPDRAPRVFLLHVERRLDPFFRPLFDKLLRGPLSTLTTALINLKRKDEGLGIAEEKIQPDEEESLQAIITQFTAQMRRLWNPGHFERGGNTKTHGIVRAELTVRDDLPENMRRGIFAEPRDVPRVGAFLRSGAVRDPGHRRRRLHEHQRQADGRPRRSSSTTSSVDPGPVRRLDADVRHARHEGKRAPPVLELPERADLLLRQLPQLRTSSTRSCSCSGRRPRRARSKATTSAAFPICSGKARRCSTRSGRSSSSEPACRACRCGRLTTTSVRRWSPRSPSVTSSSTSCSSCRPTRTGCRSRTTQSSGRRSSRRACPRPCSGSRSRRSTRPSSSRSPVLSFNPWHCIPEHRPLGNQSRARKRMYSELSRLRQEMNAEQHYEPTGDEVF